MNGQFKLGQIRPASYFSAIAVLCTVLFSLIAQDTETEQSYLITLLQWLLQTTVPMALLVFSHMLLHQWSRFDQMNPWAKLTISGLVASIFFSPIALFIDVQLGAQPMPLSSQAFLREWFDELTGVALPVTICWVSINAFWVLGFRFSREDNEINNARPDEQSSESDTLDVQEDHNESFAKLVPPSIWQDITYMKSELHYLMVVTNRNRELVLYNLRDAINSLPEDAGIQVHRSYWVNRSSITKLIKKGRQGKIIVSDGTEIPVSRNNFSKVEQMVNDLIPREMK